MSAGYLAIGFDPARGDDESVEVICRREADGSTTVMSVRVMPKYPDHVRDLAARARSRVREDFVDLVLSDWLEEQGRLDDAMLLRPPLAKESTYEERERRRARMQLLCEIAGLDCPLWARVKSTPPRRLR